MEGSRAHTLRIIVISLVFLAVGLVAGFASVQFFLHRGKTGNSRGSYLLGGSAITAKRMQAIKAARKSNKDEYEFEVKGFYPVLGQ